MKPEEFNSIVLPMRQELKCYALKLSGNDDDAEDLVQEVMLRLWNMRTRLEETKGGMMALASTMARNLFYDKCRRRKFSSDGGIDREIPFNDLTAEVHDEVRLIKLIVESLPPLQRQVFRMKEIEGYEAEEIMQITGCSADNLRKNLSRARLKIRDTYMKIMKGQR